MLIAFEGPDNTGKSHSAAALSAGEPIYNATTENYQQAKEDMQGQRGLAQCFDRIDWLSHMTYRLALPGHEWNDPRVRTVFAMPDTHLVFKLHHPLSVPSSDYEEGYAEGVPRSVNDMYMHMAHVLLQLNEVRNYSLFKTVTIMEVSHDELTGAFFQRIVEFSSPLYPWGSLGAKLVKDNQSLLEFLQAEEARR